MNVPQLKAPLVLVHGLFGYDRVGVGGWTLAHYFSGLPEVLTAAGNRVLIPWLSPTRGIAERAAQLKAFLDQEAPGQAVHLIGHSMGGLDCRHLTSQLDMRGRVLTVTTIGTPHRGSAFADWGIRNLSPVLRPIFDFFGVPRQAFYDLTTESCRKFNEQVLDVPGVRYFSVVGRYEGDWRSPEWLLSHRIVTQEEGENDGIISVASASYGERIEVWDGDHLSLVNYPHPAAVALGRWQDRSPQFAALLRRLADEGY